MAFYLIASLEKLKILYISWYSSLIALPEPGIDGLMSKCCPLISFVRTLDNGLSAFIELGQICLSLFARSTFFNYFTDEREMFKFQFSIDMSKKFALSDFDVFQ